MILLSIIGAIVLLLALFFGIAKFTTTFTSALNDAREYRKLKDKE